MVFTILSPISPCVPAPSPPKKKDSTKKQQPMHLFVFLFRHVLSGGGAGKDDILSPFCTTLEGSIFVCVLFPTSQGLRWLGMNSGSSQVIFLSCVIS